MFLGSKKGNWEIEIVYLCIIWCIGSNGRFDDCYHNFDELL